MLLCLLEINSQYQGYEDTNNADEVQQTQRFATVYNAVKYGEGDVKVDDQRGVGNRAALQRQSEKDLKTGQQRAVQNTAGQDVQSRQLEAGEHQIQHRHSAENNGIIQCRIRGDLQVSTGDHALQQDFADCKSGNGDQDQVVKCHDSHQLFSVFMISL